MTDLFGYSPPASFEQSELAGPSIHVGRKCGACGSPIINTESGFESCVKGCGKLRIPKDMKPARLDGMEMPYWEK